MNSDEVYKCIGYIVVAFFLLYIVLRTIKFQANLVEGLTGMKGTKATTPVKKGMEQKPVTDLTDEIKDLEQVIIDYLQISKSVNHDNYQNVMTELYNLLNLRQIKMILEQAQNIADGGDTADVSGYVEIIKSYQDLMDCLKYTYSSIDDFAGSTKKSGSGSII